MEISRAFFEGREIDSTINFPHWKASEGTSFTQIPRIYLQTVLPIVVALETAGHTEAALALSQVSDEALTHGDTQEAVQTIAMQRLKGIDQELYAQYVSAHPNPGVG